MTIGRQIFVYKQVPIYCGNLSYTLTVGEMIAKWWSDEPPIRGTWMPRRPAI
jgi:hypothetical protein